MTATESAPAITDQAARLLGLAAGYVGHRTIGMGLRTGLVHELADHPGGLSPDALADRTALDAGYVGVWARSAVAAGLCDRTGDRIRLAPHTATLLLDTASPAYAGALFTVLERPEVFDDFEAALRTGERVWWDDLSPEWIAGVSGTGMPFNTRLIPDGLSRVPGLPDRLAGGCRIVDTACGAGVGLVRLAQHYPACDVVGVDGDAASLDLAAERVDAADVADRVELHATPLEDMVLDRPADVVLNNISMHECRDIDQVARRVHDALAPGGWFVISDFPFPEDDAGLATVPGRIMAGVQFFEARIDDQLLPRSAYDDLLARHGFVDIDHVELAPVHAVTWGRRPA